MNFKNYISLYSIKSFCWFAYCSCEIWLSPLGKALPSLKRFSQKNRDHSVTVRGDLLCRISPELVFNCVKHE